MTANVLELRDLSVRFVRQRTPLDWMLRTRPQVLEAVAGVDLQIERGSIFGIVGESGCGKTTLAKAIVNLVHPEEGDIRFEGKILGSRRERDTRRRIQMVFQDPSSSLNPLMTVEQMLSQLLVFHNLVPKDQVRKRSAELLRLVELPESLLNARPRTLSSGQRQRIGIARALAVEPEVVIADEPVAALDMSVQATVLNLLRDLRKKLGLTILFISHDMAVIRNMCDRVAVMYLGRIVEEAEVETLFEHPRHPYTRALLASIPRMDGSRSAGEAAPSGEPPNPLDLPSGCRYHPRCPISTDWCKTADPMLRQVHSHAAACHYAFEDSHA